jgi:hypothetical protein
MIMSKCSLVDKLPEIKHAMLDRKLFAKARKKKEEGGPN